jgi:hypothetical protein
MVFATRERDAMQTFRISKVQEQSYYAIRIFGIVHLVAAVGLVVLLDGPSDGLRGVSWLFILFFLSSSAYLLVRILQARAGRIHGHYVLTGSTLAILLPGQPRMFVQRKECTGVLPGSWKLVLRNGGHLPLGSVSSKPYLKDLVSDLCKVWWPGFYGTPLWAGLQDHNRIRSLALRVDLRGHPDGRDPLLVYTVGKRHLIWQYVILAACPLCSFWFYVLLYRNWRKFSDDQFSVDSVLYGISAVASLIGITAALAAMAYIARELFLRRSANRAFVVSRRSLALLPAGKQTVYRSADALQSFNQLTGRLYFCDGSSVLAAPYLFAAPYEGMLWMLFLRWRPGHSAQTGINKVNILLFVGLNGYAVVFSGFCFKFGVWGLLSYSPLTPARVVRAG